MNAQQLAGALGYWSRLALDRSWVSSWVEGAIFPREMVFFLAYCDVARVGAIIESGRQDGYSTMILAQYVEHRKIVLQSLDIEWDRARAERCRKALAPWHSENVQLWAADTYVALGPLLHAEKAKTAVLIDGPKHFSALALLYAAAGFPHVEVIAAHNLEAGSKDRDLFAMYAGPPQFFYEGLHLNNETWRELGREEIRHCTALEAKRSLTQSTLGVMSLNDPEVRARLLRFRFSANRIMPRSWPKTPTSWRMKIHSPGLIRWLWRRKWYRLPGYLFHAADWLEGAAAQLKGMLS